MQRLRGVAISPFLRRAPVGGDQVDAGFDAPRQPRPHRGPACLRLDKAELRRHGGEIGPVQPQPHVGERAADRLDRDLPIGRRRHPERALLQVRQRSVHLAAIEHGGRGLGGLAKRHHRQLGLASGPSRAGAAQLVGAAVEQHVEPAVALARLTGGLTGAGRHVDELQGHAGRALGAQRKAASLRDSEQGIGGRTGGNAGTRQHRTGARRNLRQWRNGRHGDDGLGQQCRSNQRQRQRRLDSPPDRRAASRIERRNRARSGLEGRKARPVEADQAGRDLGGCGIGRDAGLATARQPGPLRLAQVFGLCRLPRQRRSEGLSHRPVLVAQAR